MHARIALYQVKPGTLDTSLAKARAELLPRMEQQPGLRRYVGVLIGPDTFLSMSVWETREQADAAAEMLSGWVQERLGPSLVSAENQVGEVIFMHQHPTSDTLPTIGVVRASTSKPEAGDQRQKVLTEFVPLLDRQPGFNSFAAVRIDDGRILSYLSFDTMEEAGQALTQIVPWLDEHLAPTLSSSEDYIGAITWTLRK